MPEVAIEAMDLLHELVDKRHLDELVYGTLIAVDSGDWTALRNRFHENATFDFTSHSDATEIDDLSHEIGVEAFLHTLQSVVPGFDAYQHHVTNMMHRLEGDTARTDCYVYAEHFLNNNAGDRSITVGVRYEISAQRTGEGWKIMQWTLIPSWYRGNPALYKLAMDVAARAGGQDPR